MKHIKFGKKEYVVINKKELDAALERIRLASIIARDHAEDITYYADRPVAIDAFANRIAEISNETLKYLTDIHNL